MKALIDAIERGHTPSKSALTALIGARDPALDDYLFGRARAVCEAQYGRAVYVRALIEVSSVCARGCYYCGLRAGNARAARYRLTDGEILACCARGHALGLKTFVLQGGEDPAFDDDRLTALIGAVKRRFPDCAVTLSLGERPRDSFERLRAAGADRYLLRHETADAAHYQRLHPASQSFERRMRCLRDLKDIGFHVGCGFMVGSPHQSDACLAEDLLFMKRFEPHMAGIGPFIPHRDTPFAAHPPGTVRDTLRMVALTRLMLPRALLPATTALETLDPEGRQKGVMAGANVVMPNLSPADARPKYALYDGKANGVLDAAGALRRLADQMRAAGRRVSLDRGDPR